MEDKKKPTENDDQNDDSQSYDGEASPSAGDQDPPPSDPGVPEGPGKTP